MRTMCLLAQKGGTGKTTLCLHLAVLAVELGRDDVVLDMDPQASAGSWRRRRQFDRPAVMRCAADDLGQRLIELERQGKDLVLLDTAPHSSRDAATAVALLVATCPCDLKMSDRRSTLGVLTKMNPDRMGHWLTKTQPEGVCG